jgi:hypothetical protein
MNASSGGNWRGGKKSSPPKSQSSSSAPPSNRGWKSSKKTSTSSTRKKNPKKLSQFFTVGFCLFVLLAIAIWIFWPNYQLHTHFVVLDPLQGNDRFPFAAQVNLPKSNTGEAGRFTVGKHSRTDAQTLDFFNEEELKSGKSDLQKAHVCVIYFRAATIPGSDQSHLVLLKNSTPDPEVENQHELLSDLKTKISQLPERQQIVLIVDVNSVGTDWRTGMFGDSAHREFMKWSEEFPNLTTILSCDVGERSWPSGLPGVGGTVFEMVLNDAFSLKADQPPEGRKRGDGELTLKELYEYLARETNAWVLANRSEQGQHVQIFPPIEEVELDSKGQSLVLMKALPEPEILQPDNNAAKDLAKQLPQLWKNIQQNDESSVPFSVPVLLAAAESQLRAAETNLMLGRLDVAKNQLASSEENFVNAEQMMNDSNDRIELSLARRDNLVEHSEINRWLAATRLIATINEDAPSDPANEVLLNNINAYPFGSSTVEKPRQNLLDSVGNARKRMEKSTALMFHDSFQFRPLLKQMQLELLKVEDLLFLNEKNLPADFTSSDSQEFFRKFDEQANLLEEYVLLKLEVEGFQLRLFAALPEIVEWAAGFDESAYRTELLKAIQTRQATILPTRATQAEELQFEVVNTLQTTEELLTLYLSQRTQQFNTSADLENALRDLKSKFQSLTTNWDKVNELVPQVRSSIPRSASQRWSQSFNATHLPVYNEQIRSEFIDSGMLPWSEGEPESLSDSKKLKESPASSVQFQNYREQLVWNAAWRLRLQDIMALTSTASASDVNKQTQAMWDKWELLGNASSPEDIHRLLFDLGGMIRSDWESRRNQMATSLTYSGSDLQEYLIRLLKSDMAARFFRADDVDLWRTQRDIQTAFECTNQVQYCLMLADHALLSQWINPADKPVENANKWFYQQTDAWLKLAEQLITKDATLSVALGEIDSRRKALASADEWTEQVQLQIPSLQRFEEQQEIQFNVNANFEGTRPETAISAFTFIGTEAESGSRNVLELSQNGIPLQFKAKTTSTEFTVKRLFVPKPDDCSSVSLRPQIFYRGRTIQKTPIVINPCPSSQRTWQYLAGRQTAEINVKGDDNRPIVFVLDWSASMNEKDANGDPKQRHLAAANAVEQIIEKMPPTMRVGLVVFGHSSRDAETEPNNSFKENFKDLMEINRRSPFEDVDIIHEIGLLETDREIIKHKLNLLKNVRPYASTPLGLAMTTAAQLLSRKSDSGGIVVAITDGAPTDLGDATKAFPDNPPAAQRRQKKYDDTFNDLERAFKPDDISAILFALDFGKEDLTTLNCLFGNLQNQGSCSFMGSKESLHVPIVSASGEGDRDGGTLRDVIDAEIEPRPFQVFLANGEPVAEEPLNDASIIVKAGETYRIRFGDIDIKDIQLAPGDVISLEMNWSKGRFDINRDFASHKSASVATATANQPDVPDTLRVNKIKKPNINSDPDFYESIEVDVMLDHNRSYRPVQKPEEIWFELAAIGDANFHPEAVDQEYTSKFGAPGWNLKISPWPSNRILSLNAFWKMKRTSPDEVVTLEKLNPAVSRSDAIALGGEAQPIPAFKIWQKTRSENGRQIYEVRIEPQDKITFNVLSNLTVEIGETSILKENSTFKADATTHLKTIVDSGIIVHSFEYPDENIDLSVKVIALTSLNSRKQGALQLRKPISVID